METRSLGAEYVDTNDRLYVILKFIF